MKRMFGAALLALPALLAAGQAAQAQGCPAGGCVRPAGAAYAAAGCGYGLGGPITAAGGCGYFGCGGPCMRTFPHIGQHGPLYNYGPYYGYYPFAPYGPWDANLNSTGPGPGPVGCGWLQCGHLGHWGGLGHCGHGDCGLGGCLHGHGGGWGHYSMATFHNVFQRTHPLCNRAKISTGCSACGS